MNEFIEILPEELNESPFKMIGKEWMLVTAEYDNKANSMTASWGGLGVMWGKNTAFIVIRPTRYTKEFIDKSDYFSLTFFDNKYRSVLNYLGTVSGRDENKIEKSKLTLKYSNNIPYFGEANKVLFCKKLYFQEYNPNGFIEKDIDLKWYPEHDYHTLYIAEITKILKTDK